MDIKILQLIDGTKKATGLTVVIDVFPEMTIICAPLLINLILY